MLLGQGDGTFRQAATVPSTSVGQLVAADLNGDSHVDLVAAFDPITFFAGRGDGTFEGGIPFDASSDTPRFAIADFTNTGVLGFAGISDFTSPESVVILPRPFWPSLSLVNVTAAGFGLGPLAPGEITAAFGSSLAGQIAQGSGNDLPVSLGGLQVTVTGQNGSTLSAPLHYVSPGQVNYLIPSATSPGLATVTFISNDKVTATSQLQIAPVAPALFTISSQNLPAGTILRVSQNGQQTYQPIYQVDSTGDITPIPIDLSVSTDTVYLVLFGTGIRNRSSLSAVSVNQGIGPVTYAGPQHTFEGLDQVNILLPNSLADPTGETDFALQLIVDGQPSNQVLIFIQ